MNNKLMDDGFFFCIDIDIAGWNVSLNSW